MPKKDPQNIIKINLYYFLNCKTMLLLFESSHISIGVTLEY